MSNGDHDTGSLNDAFMMIVVSVIVISIAFLVLTGKWSMCAGLCVCINEFYAKGYPEMEMRVKTLHSRSISSTTVVKIFK